MCNDEGAQEGACNNCRYEFIDHRTFFRSYSRKNLEDQEVYVSDDGVIVSSALDDLAVNERLKRLLERKDKETRQAAEYGLSLLESNEELELQVASLKIQLENDLAEVTAERELYKRRYENGLLEIDHWKQKHAESEEEKYELRMELEHLMTRMAQVPDPHDHISTSNADGALLLRIAELENALLELKVTEENSVTMIQALRQSKASMEKDEQQNSSMERAYIMKLKAQQTQLSQELDQIQLELEQSQKVVVKEEAIITQLKQDLKQLQEQFVLKQKENREQFELLQTTEAKCSRLQRELALMEHVSSLSLAVIDHDDEEEDEEEEVVRHRRSTIVPPFLPFSMDNQTMTLPSTIAIHQKLYHYFHLTAISIIHENQLQEIIFTKSSSRHTIDQWYQDVVSTQVPYLEWHAWLIQHIRNITITTQRLESRNCSSSSDTSTRHSLLPTSRVSFSVSKSFFRFLGREENQIE